MNRSERRARERQQAKAATALRKGADGVGSASEAFEIAQDLFRHGKARDALPGLRRAAAAYPDNGDLRGALAYALAASGDFAGGIEQYRALLRNDPDAVPVLTNLAFLLAKTGSVDEALKHLERAGRLAPDHANTAFALAELLAFRKRKDEAFNQYRQAARLFQMKIGPNPRLEHCDDLIKLATALMWTGDLGPGLYCLDKAVELRPDHALAHARRGLTLGRLRQYREAAASLKRAAEIEPTLTEVRRALGDMLLASGDAAAAEKYYAEAVTSNPDDKLARYFLAATRHESPDAPPPVYVENLFNGYALTFEHHLVDVLQYRAPEQVVSALLDLAGAAATNWSVVDLGCGTGLCGPLIRPAARQLIGVDLSAGMLDKAREKAVYDDLKLGDVVEVLRGYVDAFDLALCTDVMIYLGNLTPIFAAAATALKPGAWFAFTTEIHDGEGFVLDTTGRYLHSRGYVESVAASHGFSVLQFESIVARYQGLKPDYHHLYIARRAS